MSLDTQRRRNKVEGKMKKQRLEEKWSQAKQTGNH